MFGVTITSNVIHGRKRKLEVDSFACRGGRESRTSQKAWMGHGLPHVRIAMDWARARVSSSLDTCNLTIRSMVCVPYCLTRLTWSGVLQCVLCLYLQCVFMLTCVYVDNVCLFLQCVFMYDNVRLCVSMFVSMFVSMCVYVVNVCLCV